MLLPLVCPSAKEAGTVNGGQRPFISTVDCSGFEAVKNLVSMEFKTS